MTKRSEPRRDSDEPSQEGGQEAAPEPQTPLKIRRGLGLTREQIKAQIARHPKAMKKLE